VDGLTESLARHGAWQYELDREEIRWSDALYRIHGVCPETFRATTDRIRDLIHPDDRDEFERIFEKAVAAESPFTVRHRIVRPDGAVRSLIVRGSHLPAAAGPGCYVGTTEDVSDMSGTEDDLWHLANKDSLTGLFNRRRFHEELGREVAVARRNQAPGAVMMLDLDRFKEVNDSLGHAAGDAVLMWVAEALRSQVRMTDTLGRLGGDEFAIVLPGCTAPEAERIAAELAASVAEGAKVKIAGRERSITVSFGVAPFGARDSETADALMVEADLAMYRAKAGGVGGIEVFDEQMRAELAARLRLEAELREAIEAEQFRVVYQPIASLADGAAVGCEALLRWQHPTRGLVPPNEFVPVAEEEGLIAPIGRWVLHQACHQAADWRRRGANLYVSVNVSPHQLVREDFVAEVERALAESGLPAPLLCLEMTETSLVEDARPLLPTLRGLKELGVRLAIDDFGGGSSSFALLRMLPIHVIKVDRVFIEGLPERPDDRAIVAAVLSLADELDLSVIAEGVEEDRQHRELYELGCRYAQGYLYARPVPPQELDLDGYSAGVLPGVGDGTSIREFMRQIGIPARVGS
jgi:diguanylate cyclase (GGDEF)-like protein/PAS domain S-box-containing protein